MRKGLKLRKRKIQRLLSGFGLFLFVFFVSYSSGSSNMISSASRAEELYASIRENGYNISLTSTGHIALNLNVTPDGAVAMAKDTINVKSNAAGGYKLYASATQSGENGNKLILDGDSPISIPATSGTVSEPRQLDMNSWGFAVAGAAGFDDSYDINRPNTISKFAAIPLRGQEALIGSSNDITTEDGNSTDIYYGIKGNIALHSGIYSNSVTYSIVANSSNPEQDRHIVSSSPSITEKLEGGELLTITTGYTASAAAIIIEANNNNVAPAEVKVGGSVCSEVELSNDDGVLIITCITPPHDTGTYDIAVTIPTPLYYKEYFLDNAIEYKSLYPSMQRITISEARKLNPEETIALMDERDGKMYYVTKEADGNLWMTQNLDLDLAVGEDDVTMGTLKDGEFVAFTSENTDISGDSWTIPDGSVGYPTETEESHRVPFISLPEEPDPGSDPGPDPGPEVADTLLGWSQYGTNGDYDNYEVRSYHLDVNQSGVADHSHPGNFYNWPAATAGTGTYAIAAQYQNAPDSICPKGWKLPVGDQANSAENQFVNLLDSVSYDAALNDPFWFILPGVINYSDSLTGPGFMGYYWTRSNSSSQKAYIYDISNSVPGSPYQYQKKESSQNVKGDGYSIRCMKEIPIIMQEVQALDYSSVARNTTFKMMDERDGKYYYVTKEADGNLWMTQNLDLDLELDGNKIITRKNGQAVEISKDNTNITADAWTTAQSNLTTWTDTGIGVYDSGNKCQSEGIATSLTDCTTTSGSANQEHVGNFYTWTAATAGSTIETGSATTDICPSGWRLPTGGEFNSLLTGHYPTNGSNRDAELLVTPFWFLRAGYYADDGSIRDRGSYGRYWSGTADGANFAYNLYFGSDIVGPGTYNGNKSSGRALRCIKEVPIIMQEVQSSDYNSVTTGTTFKMMDNRDGKVYYVTKEGDGHLWMTQNLDLDLKISNGKINAITTNNSLTLLTNQNTDMTASNWSASSVSSWAYSTSIGVYNPGGKCIAGGTATTFSDCVSGVANHEHIGNYYSWTAATAGSAITTGNATTSICPAGWHLPIGNYGGEIQNLLNGVSSSNILNSPFWFLRTGSYGSYEVKNLGTIGLYWTSTAQDSDFSYRLYFSDHSVYQGAGADLKLYGLTIRCMK